MPGVPSGRGCDACRKQKKKCDLSQNPCTRCERLDIPCVGLGQRRFKFKNMDGSSSEFAGSTQKNRREASPKALSISRDPTNEHTHLVSAFIDTINPSRGVKYNLAWSYGDYLFDVPARLGTNEALDRATESVMAGLDTFSNDHADSTRVLLKKYTLALTALRKCLDDPVQAKSSETLAAVLMLLTVQSFLSSPTESVMTHFRGAAQIIRLRGSPQKCEPFESNLLLSLRGVVLFQSIFHSQIVFTDQEWLDLFDTNVYSLSPEGRAVQCLTRLPNLLCRARNVLKEPTRKPTELEDLRNESRCLHDEIMPPLQTLRNRLQAFQESVDRTDLQRSIALQLRHCHFIRTYALGLAFAIFANEVQIAVSRDLSSVLQESQGFAAEIVNIAPVACQYRPLGAAAMVLCLIAAELGADDINTRDAAFRLRLELHEDFQAMKASPTAPKDLRSYGLTSGCLLTWTSDGGSSGTKSS